jgi:hypothetical protein
VNDPLKAPTARDCLNCDAAHGMVLQNVTGSIRKHIPLLYICRVCGAMLTIPPPENPLSPSKDGF